jgi:U1 small nuclear ribonucleoprotein 70kDa
MSGFNPARKATPRGQMSSSQNSGPAVMLMPPEIRSTFMPNPPLQPIASQSYRRRNKWTGVAQYMVHLEKTEPPERILLPTPKSMKEQRKKSKLELHQNALLPLIHQFRIEQKESGGEYKNMNCYNTLFVGRLAYDMTERKLLREMESFGPVKDIHIIKKQIDSDTVKSRGYAFVEYEHDEDMKRAYRAMDGVRLEGRDVVVDVERGHTVPDFLPRRLGGGLGGTRLGGKHMNVTRPGRFDPNRALLANPMIVENVPTPTPGVGAFTSGGGMGRGTMGGPQSMPPSYGSPYGGQPPPIQAGPYGSGTGTMNRESYAPQRDWNDRGRDGSSRGGSNDGYNHDRSKRRRSRSPPDQRYGGSRRPRY